MYTELWRVQRRVSIRSCRLIRYLEFGWDLGIPLEEGRKARAAVYLAYLKDGEGNRGSSMPDCGRNVDRRVQVEGLKGVMLLPKMGGRDRAHQAIQGGRRCGIDQADSDRWNLQRQGFWRVRDLARTNGSEWSKRTCSSCPTGPSASVNISRCVHASATRRWIGGRTRGTGDGVSMQRALHSTPHHLAPLQEIACRDTY
jgi:hypothetical protein